ncbi:unnamed protein product [Spirodela intermedia]|uniref:Uncharacterized protein n=2 Tax=Spirodela intermedia TaxID=51605 RepID=A0A7I8IB51_SPIIN|nr:unnamed protein product [Spirodela intermedia]CAA6654929.1 unnamed protein product [Spirodela intermedia]CAA7389644.1 unnamed protein product [Spirodela intermedia]
MALRAWWETLPERRPLLVYAATWTTLLTATVAATSVLPEVAFVWAVSPASSFSRPCGGGELIRVPLDVPGEVLCLPAAQFGRSGLDLLVPPIFAAAVVAAAALLVRALGLWDDDDPATS